MADDVGDADDDVSDNAILLHFILVFIVLLFVKVPIKGFLELERVNDAPLLFIDVCLWQRLFRQYTVPYLPLRNINLFSLMYCRVVCLRSCVIEA